MPKKSYVPVTLSMHQKGLLKLMALYALITLTILLTLSFSVSVFASVSGPCSNCHTMHYSQNGAPPIGGADGPYKTLLLNDCLGCHTGTNTDASIISEAPYVYSPEGAVFGVNTLAGGNFYWVLQEEEGHDQKGHNILNADQTLNTAPGGGAFCGTTSCHNDLWSETSSDFGATLGNKQGCEKCHIYVKHHGSDGEGTKYVNSAEQGWYRFLSAAHNPIKGVEGIEHEKWNYQAAASSHNEYLGKEVLGGYGFISLGNTTTAFCSGCHGDYHSYQVYQNTSGNPWIRHPSDAVIPYEEEDVDCEYNYAFGADGNGGPGTYDPNVPVARPAAGLDWASATPKSTVEIGTDMVMCLSCHVAHGSPYDDMLRWDYSTMVVGNGNGAGCFKCHTMKD